MAVAITDDARNIADVTIDTAQGVVKTVAENVDACMILTKGSFYNRSVAYQYNSANVSATNGNSHRRMLLSSASSSSTSASTSSTTSSTSSSTSSSSHAPPGPRCYKYPGHRKFYSVP